ncbi:hypothetical protein PJF56_14910 [Roseofilum sp. BLCC_M91]|uniref:Uncharacterized protein n=1 Tax=Roseofilum halophilum BLCC-M91 TaxID=3022259 RepID=A0ABT7BNM7_9CYAN|nr:hypothetical protein [Roseofilum halophilum]MDJ1180154.1 hypothetical protein [Roseofilum halophilum BLCC-M91]
MGLQFKGWVFVQAIALTMGFSAIAHLDQLLHQDFDQNLSLEKVNAHSSVKMTLTPFCEKFCTPIF